jgi:RNA processing factor Prp31
MQKAYFLTVKKTSKYGYIHHTVLDSQSNASFQGKVARSLPAKGILSAKFEAFWKNRKRKLELKT